MTIFFGVVLALVIHAIAYFFIRRRKKESEITGQELAENAEMSYVEPIERKDLPS